MEVTKNRELLERKHFIFRAMEHGNMDKTEGEKEILKLDRQINDNLQEQLSLNNTELVEELKAPKKEVMDGDVKRGAARVLIRLLENFYSNQEIKGIFRQGYKIMRTK